MKMDNDKVKEIIKLIRNLTEEERRYIFSGFDEFCNLCGSEYLPCFCNPIFDE